MSADACSWSSTQNEPAGTLEQSGSVWSIRGMPGVPVEGFSSASQIWSWTTWMNVSDVIPESRA